MRHRHLLRRTSDDRQPAQIASVDADVRVVGIEGESRRQREILLGWHAIGASGRAGRYGKDIVCCGSDAASFWEAVYLRLRRGGTLWMFAPRASRLMMLMDLWERVDRGEVYLDGRDSWLVSSKEEDKERKRRGYAVLEDPPFIIDLRLPGAAGMLRVLDSRNYGVDFSEDADSAGHRARSLQVFIRRMIETLVSEGLGALQATAGSQAYYSFRRKHHTGLIDCHANLSVMGLERDGYYGGRCEAFRLGRLPGRVFHLDVNSLYPSIYAKLPLPVGLVGYTNRVDAATLGSIPPDCIRVATVDIYCGTPDFPYRNDAAKIVVWPVGEFRATLIGSELDCAQQTGCITRWHSVAWYSARPFLGSFARHVQQLRGLFAEDHLWRKWCKSLGVCIVGKLGQRERRWLDDRSGHITPLWGSWVQRDSNEQWIRWRSFAGIEQREELGDWSFNAIPAAAATITAAGRMRLLYHIKIAHWEQVYYVDTDALMVSEKGYSRLWNAGCVDQQAIGKLKIEGVYQNVRIRGIKDYEADGRNVCAGSVLSGSYRGSGANLECRRVGLIGHMQGGRPPLPVVVTARFTRVGRYRHGTVGVTGIVSPFWLGRDRYERVISDCASSL